MRWQTVSALIVVGVVVMVGAVVFGTLPDGATWLGATVIIGAGLYLAYTERKR